MANHDDNDVRDRIAGRKAAETIVLLATEEAAAFGYHGKTSFWYTLADALSKYLPQASPARQPEPMNDKAAQVFGQMEMKFGKYRGQPLDEVPVDYLVMLVDDNEWKQQVRRYLRSPRIQRELEVCTLNGEDES